ncbi:MAG: hypothetical protein GOMPHAMPRED_005252 [Gomphillus americanus]|uniref:Uncharacterized protein n=1 Tax=Gomphillus americanus TaxID=1940652 RepID=A0A8H3IRJ7_9LECA|nr:MAG: hypothetical protein GOMPHAMPRED_005252 [Gomphillus americanus]
MVAVTQPSLAKILYICLAGFLSLAGLLGQDASTRVFAALFIFRYYRLLVGITAYFFHRAVPVSAVPVLGPCNVTAILPTVDPQSPESLRTFRSVLGSGVARLLVVIPLDRLWGVNYLEHEDLASAYLDGRLRIQCCFEEVDGRQVSIANKRQQVAKGLEVVEALRDTPIVVLVDDHVEWPTNFLVNILAPFANSRVGGVATWKRVKRRGCLQSLFGAFVYRLWHKMCLLVSGNNVNFPVQLWPFLCCVWFDFWNFIGCLYLERHNFDITASHYIDKSIFVVSGRTAAYRSEIICTSEFRKAFCNESWFGVGPLNADDDNFITRWLIKHNWQIGWQHGAEATILTTVGDSGFLKFNAQCLRWARTAWRSNWTSLWADHRAVLASYPWSIYAIYLTSFVNFALLTDSVLLGLCWKGSNLLSVFYILLWIVCSKLVKPMPHFLRHPRDLVYFPGYVLFGYYHSLLKLYALFTLRNIAWGSRPGVG